MSTADSAWAVTPLSGSLQVQTHAFVQGGVKSDTDLSADGWVGAPREVFTFARSEASYAYADESITAAAARAADSANWSADGSSGNVLLDWRWDLPTLTTTGTPDPELRGASFDGLAPNWSYTFRADHDGLLRWQGQVRPSPEAPNNQTFGLSGWNLQLNGVTVIDIFDTSGAGPRQGDADFALVAGETYTFSLINNSNIAGRNFSTDYRGQMLGEFYWDIVETPTTTVPEPGVWAMMILGFACTGVGIRLQGRRRQPAAAARA